MFRTLVPAWVFVFVALMVGGGSCQDSARESNWRSFDWHDGQLVAFAGRSVPSELLPVVDAINRREFKKAVATLKPLRATSAQVRAELAIAIAGHLNNDEPQEALSFARQSLESEDDRGESFSARRLLNEIDVYETFHAVKLPWAERSPGHSFVPAPQLVPARDKARAGNVDEAREMLHPLRNAAPTTDLLTVWQMAAFFQNDPNRDVFNTLLDDVDEAMQRTLARGNDEDRMTVQKLTPLLKLAKRNAWASLTVPPESLLYARAMLEPMRAYYWWYRQMGGVRPMAKQGFDEILAAMKQRFPAAPIVKVYSGQQVPWGDEEVQLTVAPADAPAWAVKQRELRARVDHVVRWWFRVRQQADGQLGGGWEDDCEALRRFTQSALICNDQEVKAGINRLADGIWERSGQIVNGFDRQMKDVEHASEMAADTSVLLALDYGNPTHFERFLQSCRTTDEVHFGTNESGRRQYKAMVLNAERVSDDPNVAFDVMYAGRAMRPVAMVAWYSRNPRAVKLLSDWARTWSEAAAREADGKPAGIFPAAIRFASERLDGRNTWWDPGLGDLYRWRPQDIDMVLAKVLEAWRLTGDDSLLAGVKAQLNVMREGLRESRPQNPSVGSLDWATNQFRGHGWMAAWYRSYTGRTEYDFLAPGVSYWRFQTSDHMDVPSLGNLHQGDLNAMRFNLPMMTTEVRGTDRINMAPWSLTSAMTGSHVPITQTPAYAVTWNNVSRDFAALVGQHGSRSVRVWLYTCSEQAEQPAIRFWQLAAGRYRLKVQVDQNFDAKPDGEPIKTIDFDCRERLTQQSFSLPNRKLVMIEVAQLKPFPPRDTLQPDLAISNRDIKLLDVPQVGDDCRGSITLHNIGSADAANIEIEVQIVPKSGGKPFTIKQQVDQMSWPKDLTAQRKVIPFSWTPMSSGPHQIVADVTCSSDASEICSFNNRATKTIQVE